MSRLGLLLPLLLASRSASLPLVVPYSGLEAALSAPRQAAPSQGVLGVLQQVFRAAAAGQQSAAEYGAPRDQLQQIVSSLDQLAAVVPQGQRGSENGTSTTGTTTTTERPADVPIIDPGQQTPPDWITQGRIAGQVCARLWTHCDHGMLRESVTTMKPMNVPSPLFILKLTFPRSVVSTI